MKRCRLPVEAPDSLGSGTPLSFNKNKCVLPGCRSLVDRRASRVRTYLGSGKELAMTKDTVLTDKNGKIIVVAERESVLDHLKNACPDGEYIVKGPGIDAVFYRHDGIVYPAGGSLDGETMSRLSLEECIQAYSRSSHSIETTVGEFCKMLHTGQIRQSPPTTILTPEQQAQIKSLWDECVRHSSMFKTLEQFELGFCRDRHPDKEIAVWMWIAEQFKLQQGSAADKQRLIDDLLLQSFERFPPTVMAMPVEGIRDGQHRSGGL